MNLKTLMRYDAFLQGKINEADLYLRGLAVKTTVTHLIPGKEVKTIIAEDFSVFDDVSALLNFRVELASIRLAIANEIEISKSDLDVLVAKNIILRNEIALFDWMLNARCVKDQEGTAQTYGLNVAGDQILLRYPTLITSVLSFSASAVQEAKRDLMVAAEVISERIEKIKAGDVDFEQEFSFGLSLKEMYTQSYTKGLTEAK